MFPLNFWDISMLLAVTSIVLLVTSELLSTYYGKVHALINKKRLKNTAIAVSAIFAATIVVRIITIIISL